MRASARVGAPRIGRRRHAWAAAVVCVLLGAASAWAAPNPIVKTAWRVVSQPVAERGPTELALDVTLDRGWHVNANDPDREYLIPTELVVTPPAGVALTAIRYPEPVIRSLAFAEGKPLRLYEGTFTIVVRLDGPRSDTLTAELRYQACTDETCLPPRTLDVSLAGEGRGAAVGVDPGDDSTFARWLEELGLAATLGIAMVLGLGLNLTPCVYPLISVTIAYFGGQGGGSSGRVVTLAGAYALGIAVTFSLLGVGAALSGGLFGAALQQPAVLVGIAAVLVLLAASNFGLYQFRAPAFLVQRTGTASAGLAGALFMGLTMGLVAAPCVGPIIVALLIFVASRQDAVLGFVLFFALALGMGLPYVGLAVAASSIRRLPRSGEWLAWVERLFGCVLLVMALYFLGPLLGEATIAVAMPLLVAGAGVYLGFLDPAGRGAVGFTAVKRAVGVAAIVAAAWLAVPRGAESAIAWQPFSDEALGVARQAGRPAVVDFTATWCLPCRENDAVTFTDPEVGAAADRFVMLRADVTEMTEQSERWLERYRVLGVPTILVFSADGSEASRVVGFVEPERFVALLEQAAGT